ncbi:hypothetical protein M4I21_00445 [Cellulophaga sp. 20_2_10]|uniref:hypothetical protein n=1 Tax=Cellulophaga sp. 20_2_10 TaxID=2942476 RepID=UPI00201A9596|nr:hypothetical protein [Cellulophaga sp. 20_2_10]MCL5244257.1 hypothetical protein [Cellulophaga sp. 20_2_10]
MKKQLLIASLFLVSLGATAQKIKEKKGEIFLDKVKVANIEKIKTETPKYYQISDVDGNPLFKVKTITYESILFHDDETTDYHVVTGDKIQDTLAIVEKGFYITQKRIVKYLVEAGFLNNNGYNEANIPNLIAKSIKIPTKLVELQNNEKELKKHIGYKVERDFENRDIFIKSYAPKQTTSIKSTMVVTATELEIYQNTATEENPDSEPLLIGYGVYEFKTFANNTTYKKTYLLNAKRVPLASYVTYNYKTYVPFRKEESDKLDKLKTKEEVLKAMAINHILREKL